MLEIEIKAIITDKTALKAAMCAQGFIWRQTLLETDIYYCGVNRDFALTDEALRLRTTENQDDNEIKTVLTYKGPKLDTVSKTRKELEVGILDGPCMQELLHALGHQAALTVRKRREYYTREGITACVDEVEGLGSYVELETLSDTPGGQEAAVEGLFVQLKQLGIPRESCTRKSYLEMLLEKGGVV